MVEIERRLRRALAGPLPGLDAHLRMAPSVRPGWDPHDPPPHLRHAAALVLVYPIDATPHVLLTVRATSLRSHTGQVSLPGGRLDDAESVEAAALREAHEEVGVSPGAVRVLGRLTPLHIPVSGHLLHPVVGFTSSRPAFTPDPREVARILEVPLATLQDPAVVTRETWTREVDGRRVDLEVPLYAIDGEQVWGATAMVLAELVAAVQDATRPALQPRR